MNILQDIDWRKGYRLCRSAGGKEKVFDYFHTEHKAALLDSLSVLVEPQKQPYLVVTMSRTLVLLADSNLFIQCRPLRSLEWGHWPEFGKIKIVVCRPILGELDKHKSLSRGRVQKKAREASRLFREIILGTGNDVSIRDSEPSVILELDGQLEPDDALRNILDFGKPDDELVGICSTYQHKFPDVTAKVFTDDTGPMIRARECGVSYLPIPSDFFLDVEKDDSEKEKLALQTEIAKLKNSEPKIMLWPSNDSGEKSETVDFTRRVYTPMSKSQVADLMSVLRAKFPAQVDFTPTKRAESSEDLKSLMDVFLKQMGPSDQEIKSYTQELYPQWLVNCERFFKNLHEQLNLTELYPIGEIRAENSGSRPAKNVLVSFEAAGNILVMAKTDDRKNPRKTKSDLSIPAPPSPPRGIAIDFLSKFRNDPFAVNAITNPLGALHRPLVDQNKFYWHPPHHQPASSIGLDCSLWRHGQVEERFRGGTDK